MNDQDYAIVIGLGRYPEFVPAADLAGPTNDVEAIKKWLRSPTGGDLPKDNIYTVTSPPAEAKPTHADLEDAFMWVDKLAAKNVEELGVRKVGRRLYFYLSGHGFSPQHRHGCFLAGNASSNRPTANIGATLWLDWWQDAGYFNEYVLWMDCCMNRLTTARPAPAPLSPVTVLDPPSATFIAFGAERPLRAVEYRVDEDDGKYHGVFTWNLIKGLEGAAADAYGRVTGRSLADWLRNSVLPALSDDDRQDPEVSKQPAIIAEDAAVIFARRRQRPKFTIKLQFPGELVGKTARLWYGVPPTSYPLEITAEEIAYDLVPGLYVVEVPDAGYRHGFAVTSACTVRIENKGDPVAPASNGKHFKLAADPDDPTAKIRVIANDFSILESQAGILAAELVYGLYKLQVKIGRQIIEQVLLLDGDFSPPVVQPGDAPRPGALNLPAITSAAPLPKTATTDEIEINAVRTANDAAADKTIAGGGGHLMLMARVWRRDRSQVLASSPWDGITLVNRNGELIADLGKEGSDTTQDGYRTLSLALPAGMYFLRRSGLGGHPIEQSLVIPAAGPNEPRWRLEAYILNKQQPAGDEATSRPVFSVLMRRQGQSWNQKNDTILEKARVALADEKRILNGSLNDLLVLKFENPLAGIIGGHLLLIQARLDARQLGLLDTVVRNLRALVGNDHPDVEALSLRCPNKSLRTKRPLSGPPMFEASWRLAIVESQSDSKIIPLDLWRKVEAQVGTPPFLTWSADEEVRKDYRKELSRMMFGSRMPDLGIIPPAAEAALPAFAAMVPMGGGSPLQHIPKRLSRAALENLSAQLHVPLNAIRDMHKEWLLGVDNA